MTESLKYPHDRFNGFVQLTDGNGNAYVPAFSREHKGGSDVGNAMKYSGAFMVLARRMNNGLI